MRGLVCGVGMVVVLSSPALADNGLNVERWLARPGVRMLAVELYATWCKPCMEAVPRWRALHERYYADQGNRI